MKGTRKQVVLAFATLIASVALLAGATFAWFTDSIVNSGNTITAGELKINAYAYDYDANATGAGYTIEGVNGGNTIKFSATGRDLRTKKVIEEEAWEPGKSSAKLLQVANGGSLAADVTLEFTTGGDLTEALWFDFIQVKDGAIAGTFTKRPMSTLSALAQGLELQLLVGERAEFIFVYGMNEEANNDYQGATFTVDVTIVAKQAAVEADGFGNTDYDADAAYPVIKAITDVASLKEALKTVGVPVSVDVTESLLNVKLDPITGEVTLNLGKSMLSHSSTIVGTTLSVADGGSLTIKAEANDYGFDYTAGQLNVTGEQTLLKVNGGRYGVSGAGGAEVSVLHGKAVLNDGIFSSSGSQGHAVMASEGGVVYINGGRYSCSGAQSVGFYADDGTIYLEKNAALGYMNGCCYGVANGGKIYISKTFSASKPTDIASGCTVTDGGDYWVITEA